MDFTYCDHCSQPVAWWILLSVLLVGGLLGAVGMWLVRNSGATAQAWVAAGDQIAAPTGRAAARIGRVLLAGSLTTAVLLAALLMR